MPAYEASLLLRCMKSTETAQTLKRAAEAIFNKGGLIRKIENLGTINLPCKISIHGKIYRQADQFVIYFDAPPASVGLITGDYGRDMNFVRNKIFKLSEPISKKCTFYEENLPAPYRENVQKLMDLAPTVTKNKFRHNSGLGYYPFSK